LRLALSEPTRPLIQLHRRLRRDAEKLAELVGAMIGGWSKERDAPLALVSHWA
jgi:hypothetical protein